MIGGFTTVDPEAIRANVGRISSLRDDSAKKLLQIRNSFLCSSDARRSETDLEPGGSRDKPAPSAPVKVMKQKGESPIQRKRALC